MSEVVVTVGQAVAGIDRDIDAWLGELVARMKPADHVVSHRDGGPLPLFRDSGGGWRAGAVIGSIRFQERSLTIQPPAGALADTRSPSALCVAEIWCRGIEGATRHGPPAIHQHLPHVGGSLRGRLDVRSTVRLRAKGSSNIASVYRARDLRNQLSAALVAADRALTRQIGHDRWRTKRVREVMPQLHDAVGRHVPVPTLLELSRIRYSPITRPFRDIAELSVRVVLQDPLVTTIERDRPQGLFVPFSA